MQAAPQADPETSTLIACPECDALYLDPDVPDNHDARCQRCGTMLAAPRTGAFTRVFMLALTALILMVAAVFFPFLQLNASGLVNRTSVFDAVMAFDGLMLPLSLAVALLIVLLPALRLAAIAYTLWPLMRNRPPYAHARRAFRLAEDLRPWSMAEIFVVGVSVALVKVAGMAVVSLGPAFWAFAALVIVTVLQNNFMCRHTIWRTLERYEG